MNAGVLVFVFLVVLSFLGLPIYLSIAVGTMVSMVYAGFPLEAVAQKTFLGLNSASLLSIPFFILAGNLMARGITQKLIGAANVVVGRVRGSLGAVTVLASALFGAISGSAVATVAAIGGMKCVVKTAAGPGNLQLQEKPIPSPKAGEVLVKVHLAAICGTDIHIKNWADFAQQRMSPPTTIGHGSRQLGYADGYLDIRKGHA